MCRYLAGWSQAMPRLENEPYKSMYVILGSLKGLVVPTNGNSVHEPRIVWLPLRGLIKEEGVG